MLDLLGLGFAFLFFALAWQAGAKAERLMSRPEMTARHHIETTHALAACLMFGVLAVVVSLGWLMLVGGPN